MTTIDRVCKITRRQFLSEYLLANRPVVITDGLRDWAALRRWSPEYFLSKFGDIIAPVSGNFFHPEQQLRLSSFIELLRDFAARQPSDFDVTSSVPYLRLPCPETGTATDRVKVFAPLRDDWTVPYFLPRSLYAFPFDMRGRGLEMRLFPEQSLLIAARGACTGLHVDRTNDTALICQVSGVKAAFLFPPVETSYEHVREEFWHRKAGTLSPKTAAARDLLAGTFPCYKGMDTYYAEVGPGDILVIPKRWPHEVFALETSVALTYNFMHLTDVDWKYLRYRLGEALGRLRDYLANGASG